MLTIVFLDADSLGKHSLLALNIAGTRLQCYSNTASSQCLERLKNAEIVISNKVMLDRAVLSQLPQLKLICIAATGTNNVDLEAAHDFGILVCNVRDYALTAVPQHCMALLLALTNQIIQNHQAVMGGAWSQSPLFCLHQYPQQALTGRTMTIVGYGGLGQATARLAQAFGMQICIAERPGASSIRAGRVDFQTALKLADVLSLHCPATQQGYLITAEQLRWLKPTALLINTARGTLVEPLALAAALRQGQLAGAALDVLTQEPPAITDPLLAPDIPNLILSPHVAWANPDAINQLVRQLADNIQAYLAGKPRYLC